MSYKKYFIKLSVRREGQYETEYTLESKTSLFLNENFTCAKNRIIEYRRKMFDWHYKRCNVQYEGDMEHKNIDRFYASMQRLSIQWFYAKYICKKLSFLIFYITLIKTLSFHVTPLRRLVRLMLKNCEKIIHY